MPGFNQTGPMGQGPMTGRRMGRCTSFGTGRRHKPLSSDEVPENLPPRGGFGRRRFASGGGMGWRQHSRGI